MSRPAPARRDIVSGCLITAPTVRTTGSGIPVAILRINVLGIEELVLTAFGPTLVCSVDSLMLAASSTPRAAGSLARALRRS